MRRIKVALVTVATSVALLLPDAAEACPVCFGASDDPMAQGLNNGILFLLVVVAAVQGGFAALFFGIRRRVKRLQERKESLEVIDGGGRDR